MKLCLTWDGDFESLKIFTLNVLQLTGIWTSPGGDKKVFTSDFVSLKWFKNKKVLHVEGNNANKVVLKLLRLIDGEYGVVQKTVDAGVAAPCSCLELLPEIERMKSDMTSLQSKILNRLDVVEGKLKQNIVEKHSLSNVNFLLHGNLHTDDNSSMFETIDFDICEAPIVSTEANKQLNNGSESPLIEIANSKEIDNNDLSSRKHTDNLSRQSYNKNSIINSISNGDTDDNSSRLETIDFDICEAPIVSTAPVNKQLNNGSESPVIENANSKEIDNNDSSNCSKHTDNLSRQSYNNEPIINSINNGDIQEVSILSKERKIPVRITQRRDRKNN